MRGLALLQPLGLKHPGEEVIKIWLSFFNGEELPEDERLNITPEEFEEACKHLARTLTRIYPNDNIVCILMNRVKDCRKEQDDKKEEPTKIKVQPTHYGGANFRSRLEAHWALFFDSLGWSWTYEPQQYDLGKYKYTPDFLLIDFDIFIEIKPKKKPELKDWAIVVEKCELLHRETKKGVWLICGPPTPPITTIFAASNFGNQDDFADCLEFSECLNCGAIYLQESHSLRGTPTFREKIEDRGRCESPNIVPFRSLYPGEVESHTVEESDEDFEESLEPLAMDDPESPDYKPYRYNEFILHYLEGGPPTRLKKAFLAVQRSKDDRAVLRGIYPEENIEYGSNARDPEIVGLLKDLVNKVFKSFP